MKKKFESNVAADIPKTKLHEPMLPWKLTEDDVGCIGPKDDDLKAAISGAAPLKTRAPFLILLVITVFGITTYLVSNAVIENENMRTNVAKKDGEVSLMQMNLLKTTAEKEAINKNAAQLEKKVSDLTAQKQLFASVIESLTKKGEDLDVVAAAPAAPVIPPEAVAAAPATVAAETKTSEASATN
ncbi:MAG: hypothetical protein WCY36_00525 [Candidatus Omnitrophota bacterium]